MPYHHYSWQSDGPMRRRPSLELLEALIDGMRGNSAVDDDFCRLISALCRYKSGV